MKKLRVAYIHNEKRITTGANYINDLITQKLRTNNISVKNFYPRTQLLDGPHHLKGLTNILFFYSLLENKDEILHCDLIQGTTYTPLTFLPFDIPVICHFGSTTYGFLISTPINKNLDKPSQKFFLSLKKAGAIKELNIKTRKPLRDISAIEQYTAMHADAVIATSQNVKKELEKIGISSDKIRVIHNAIEDYWFFNNHTELANDPKIVFLGRLGNDVFNFKLKGLDRVDDIFSSFSNYAKTIITITINEKLGAYFKKKFPNLDYYANVPKNKIVDILSPLFGSILFISSRYEGFSLSLIEGMSQGLIPVTYNVGVAEEIIKNGENGYIVENQIQAKKIINELLVDKDLRVKLAQNAKNTAQQFKADGMVQQLKSLYEDIVKNKKHS